MNILFATSCKGLFQRFKTPLEHGGGHVMAVKNFEDMQYALNDMPDILVIDNDNFDQAGLSSLSHVRKSGLNLPVVILTADHDLKKLIAFFNAGADECFKPTDNEAMVYARFQALQRRMKGLSRNILEVGNVSLDIDTGEVNIAGAVVEFTKKQRLILEAFLSKPLESAVRTQDLHYKVYGDKPEAADPSALKVFVCQLRKKMADHGADVEISTLWTVGYQLKAVEKTKRADIAPKKQQKQGNANNRMMLDGMAFA
jgi:DNA-binding response OmpR family regulator